jgi:hypothetical protein
MKETDMFTKQMVAIDEVPAGWKLLAYRLPAINEWILDNDGNIKQITVLGKDKELIVSRLYTQPAWMPRRGWLYKTSSGGWAVSLIAPTHVPTINAYTSNGPSCDAAFLGMLYDAVFVAPTDTLITDLR